MYYVVFPSSLIGEGSVGPFDTREEAEMWQSLVGGRIEQAVIVTDDNGRNYIAGWAIIAP